MTVQQLESICVLRIYELLKLTAWKNCCPNPFESLPSSIINQLMAEIQSCSKLDPPKIDDVHLLLTSGKLTRINFTPFDTEEVESFFSEVLHETIDNPIKSLCMLLENIEFKTVVNDECIKSFIQNDVETCKELPQLRKHGDDNNLFRNFLGNLESLCVKDLDVELIGSILMNCPKLVSLDLADSLDALELIHKHYPKKYLRINSHSGYSFQLRRCVWGKTIKFLEKEIKLKEMKYKTLQVKIPWVKKLDIKGILNIISDICSNYPPLHSVFTRIRTLLSNSIESFCLFLNKGLIPDIPSYVNNFTSKIKTAISMCPLVQELVICVLHKDSIKELKNLKHLTNLSIDFRDCDGDYLAVFIKFVQEIGSQLKHLSVTCSNPLPVDTICDHCPNLESLEIEGDIKISNPKKISSCRAQLRKLRIKGVDKKCLMFFLSSCKGLEEIAFKDASCLDDSFLNQILDINPLSKVKVAFISHCPLSAKGIRMLAEKAINLEKISILVTGLDHYAFFKSIVDEMKVNSTRKVELQMRSAKHRHNLIELY